MSDININKLRKALADDPEYDRFKNIVKKFSLTTELESLMLEVETMHRTREVRKLYSNKPSPKSIISASLQDGAFRSRAVEILMKMMKSQLAIEKAIQAVTAYIQTEYPDYVDCRTKIERERVMRVANARAIKYLEEIEASMDIIRLFIEDCDKVGYTLKNSIEALKILYGKEHVVSSI